MGCEFRDGMIICSRGKTHPVCPVTFCGRPSVALCDYPVERKGVKGTCDSPMCVTHRHPVGPNQDWCEAHYDHERRQREAARGDDQTG